MPDTKLIIACCELSLMAMGLGLLWRLVLRSAARKNPVPAALPRWEVSLHDFFGFLAFIFAGGFLGSLAAGLILNFFPLKGAAAVSAATAAWQLGILGGIGGFNFSSRDLRVTAPSSPKPNVMVTGGITFLIGLSVATAVNFLWQGLLYLCGLPEEKQDIIGMFLEADSSLLIAVMGLLACVGAPLWEELVFRGGVFRFARTRLPRWGALLLPACFFGAVHNLNLTTFAPLVALGVVFSLAYERTGRIGTCVVAHALFNLNTILLILGGIEA
jgi:uncharacterized protein